MTEITTTMLKALIDELEEKANPETANINWDDADDIAVEIVKKYPWAKADGADITLEDGSKVALIDMGDGSAYGWFWCPGWR